MSNFFNKKCPICLEKDEEGMFGLECLHRLHLRCSEKLTSFECPLCRKIINIFPQHIKDLIEKNIVKNKRENEIEDASSILRSYTTTLNELSNLLIHPTPQVEVLMALEYLIENGIPLRYIPEVVSITFFKEQPPVELGYVFGVVVDTVLGEVIKDTFRIFDTECIEDDSIEEVSDINDDHPEEEYPFSEEDEKIEESINRNIRVRRI